MKNIVITIDAGGTTISAAAMDLNYNFVTDIQTYPAHSTASSEDIINHFYTIIHDLYTSIDNNRKRLIGISFGFPGPFDYARGISFMKNLGKYDSLYGIPFKDELMKRLINSPLPNQINPLPISFVNDASLYVLGEYYQRHNKAHQKMMGITLGTGCGSTFIDSGNIVYGQKGIPLSGMIFNMPYKDSIIDDYVSKRGILSIAQKYGYPLTTTDVYDLYTDATDNNPSALQVFSDFGTTLLDALSETINAFQPDVIVIGGQISKSFQFFGQPLKHFAYKNNIEILLNSDSTKSALIGAMDYYCTNYTTSF